MSATMSLAPIACSSGDVVADVAETLHRHPDAGQVGASEPVPDRGPNPEPDPTRRDRRRIAAAARAPEHARRLGTRAVHVGRAGTDVLAGVVAAAEAVDRPPERPEQRL